MTQEEYDNLKLKVARTIVGPRSELPSSSKFTLEEIQEVSWLHHLSDQERKYNLMVASYILELPEIKAALAK